MRGVQTQNAAIGIFDSGVGGVSVLRHIHTLLPKETLLYVADSGHAPYGDKSVSYISQRVFAIADYLQAQGVKALVVACNTATAAAVEDLRRHVDIPVIGMEPAVKPAATLTRSGVVGVLATTGTLASDRFSALVEQHAQSVQVIVQCCVGLVEQIERGQLLSDETRALVESYVQPLLMQGADTLVLGCTHYPFLESVIREVAGADVMIVDTGPAVARQLRRKLEEKDLLATESQQANVRFLSSGDLGISRAVLESLWSGDVELDALKC